MSKQETNFDIMKDVVYKLNRIFPETTTLEQVVQELYKIENLFGNTKSVGEVIAFVGRAGSGKDYQCSLLEKQGYKKIAFADALREIAFAIFDLDQKIAMEHYDILKSYNCVEFMDYDNKHTLWQHKQLNFRQILENLGTQGIRNYDNDFWARCVVHKLQKMLPNEIHVCISDLRFPNEYKLVSQFCKENNINFKCIFCDYHSDRYQENNEHDSAKMSNYFCTHGYKDLTEITDKEINEYMKEQ